MIHGKLVSEKIQSVCGRSHACNECLWTQAETSSAKFNLLVIMWCNVMWSNTVNWLRWSLYAQIDILQPLLPRPLDNIQVVVTVWRLRGNIIRTALCWIVWHNVHSQLHTYMSSSYRSNRLGLSHWDSYAVRRSGCLELYYCNMVEWF